LTADNQPFYVQGIHVSTVALNPNGQRNGGGSSEIKDPEMIDQVYTMTNSAFFYDQETSVCINLQVDFPDETLYVTQWQVDNAAWGAVVNLTLIGGENASSSATIAPGTQQPLFTAFPTIQAGCTF
jgi:hypothetical protein